MEGFRAPPTWTPSTNSQCKGPEAQPDSTPVGQNMFDQQVGHWLQMRAEKQPGSDPTGPCGPRGLWIVPWCSGSHGGFRGAHLHLSPWAPEPVSAPLRRQLQELGSWTQPQRRVAAQVSSWGEGKASPGRARRDMVTAQGGGLRARRHHTHRGGTDHLSARGDGVGSGTCPPVARWEWGVGRVHLWPRWEWGVGCVHLWPRWLLLTAPGPRGLPAPAAPRRALTQEGAREDPPSPQPSSNRPNPKQRAAAERGGLAQRGSATGTSGCTEEGPRPQGVTGTAACPGARAGAGRQGGTLQGDGRFWTWVWGLRAPVPLKTCAWLCRGPCPSAGASHGGCRGLGAAGRAPPCLPRPPKFPGQLRKLERGERGEGS